MDRSPWELLPDEERGTEYHAGGMKTLAGLLEWLTWMLGLTGDQMRHDEAVQSDSKRKQRRAGVRWDLAE